MSFDPYNLFDVKDKVALISPGSKSFNYRLWNGKFMVG